MPSYVSSLKQKTYMLQVLITVKDQDLLGAKFMGKVSIHHVLIQKRNAVKYPKYRPGCAVLEWPRRNLSTI